LINYSLYLTLAGKAEQSLEAALQAKELDRHPDGLSMVTHYQLGWSYLVNDQPLAAVEHFSASIPHQPNFPFAYYFRGLAYEQLGNITSAQIEYKTTGLSIRIDSKGFRNGPIYRETIKELRSQGIEVPE